MGCNQVKSFFFCAAEIVGDTTQEQNIVKVTLQLREAVTDTTMACVLVEVSKGRDAASTLGRKRAEVRTMEIKKTTREKRRRTEQQKKR